MSAMIRYPDFLVIGAMKSGTTTLYRDLQQQPTIFVGEKEPNILLDGDPGDYGEFFADANSDQILGEVSPDYAKLPDRSAGVVERAKSHFTPKIIFIARHPVERLISHHAFDVSQQGRNTLGMPAEIDQAVVEFPQLLNYSRYAMQLGPWIEAYGRDSVHFVRFEDYISNRATELEKIGEFLGHSFDSVVVNENEIHNQGVNRPIATPRWRWLLDRSFYRRFIRPMIGSESREKLRRRLLPPSSTKPLAPPSPETLAFIQSELAPDVAALTQSLGLDTPPWNLE